MPAILSHLLGWLQRHTFLVLLGSFALGLTLPGLESTPASALISILALQLFLACFRSTVQEMRGIQPLTVLFCCTARYCILPVLLYFLSLWIAPNYSIGILLLALIPAGVSSPAFVTIYGGNVALAITLVLVSSLLALITIPFGFSAFSIAQVQVDGWAMLRTLLWVLVLPFLCHLPLRRIPKLFQWMNQYATKFIVVLMAALLVLVAARQRANILSDTTHIWSILFWSALVYFLFYVVGWRLSWRESLPNRVSYTLVSGVNNIMLGTLLATIYFPGDTTTFLLLSNLPWIIVLMPVQAWLRKKSQPSA